MSLQIPKTIDYSFQKFIQLQLVAPLVGELVVVLRCWSDEHWLDFWDRPSGFYTRGYQLPPINSKQLDWRYVIWILEKSKPCTYYDSTLGTRGSRKIPSTATIRSDASQQKNKWLTCIIITWFAHGAHNTLSSVTKLPDEHTVASGQQANQVNWVSSLKKWCGNNAISHLFFCCGGMAHVRLDGKRGSGSEVLSKKGLALICSYCSATFQLAN